MKNTKYIVGLFILLVTQVQSFGQKIWMVIASDEMENPLGLASQSDTESMKELFGFLGNRLHYEFETFTINTADKFNRRSLLARIDEINPIAEDMVVFYYTGRLKYQGEEFPHLNLNDSQENPISLLEVSNRIQEKNNKLISLIIAEGREKFVPLSSGEHTMGKSSAVNPQSSDSTIIANLFLRECGTMIVTSHKKNGTSFTLPGGHGSEFTERFIENVKLSLHYRLITLSLKNMFQADFLEEASEQAISQNDQSEMSKFFPCESAFQQRHIIENPTINWSISDLENSLINISQSYSESEFKLFSTSIQSAFESPDTPVTVNSYELILSRSDSPKLAQSKTLNLSSYLKELSSSFKILEAIEIISSELEFTQKGKIKEMTLDEMWVTD